MEYFFRFVKDRVDHGVVELLSDLGVLLSGEFFPARLGSLGYLDQGIDGLVKYSSGFPEGSPPVL